MVTKAKTAATPAAEASLESRLSEAISLAGSNREQAVSAFEAIAAEASANGQVSLARTARNYLESLNRKQAGASTAKPSAELEASVLLNGRRSEEALTLMDKALAADKARPTLCYLKALALVQMSRFEESAEALRQALTLDPSLKHQYLMEPDFNPARRQACFVDFETV